MPAFLQRLKTTAPQILRLAERGGERCGGPVLLAGLVLGLGVVELTSGALGQTSRFSLELLILLVLQLVGPMLVTLIAMALLLPRWLESTPDPNGRWGLSVAASALIGAVLLLMFFAAAVTGGVLASPRADLFAEFGELFSGVGLSDLMRSCMRASVFLGVLCGWSQLRGHRRLQRNIAPVLVSSDLMVEGLMLLLGLKLLWITAIDPLRLSAASQ